MSTTSLKLSELIQSSPAKPVKRRPKRTTQTAEHTPRKITEKQGILTVETEQGQQVGAFADILREAGYDPAYYALDTIQGVRTSHWDAQRKEWGAQEERWVTKTVQLKSHRFRVIERTVPVDVDELASIVTSQPASTQYRHEKDGGTLLLTLGDSQFGKAFLAEDGQQIILDNIDYVLSRTIEEAKHLNPSKIVLAWLGDCIEGVVTQGGRNAPSNVLTLTEQLRLVRRVQLKMIDRLIDAGYPVIDFISVPGNHDDVTRVFNARVDDSYAVESALAVADAMALHEDRYGSVSTYVPGRSEDFVTREYSGVPVGFHHGHQHRPGKQWEWWAGQTFGDTPMGNTKVLFEGHHHHSHVESRAGKLYVGVPAMEPDSQWWIRVTGQTGDPGAQLTYLLDSRVERSYTVWCEKYEHYYK